VAKGAGIAARLVHRAAIVAHREIAILAARTRLKPSSTPRITAMFPCQPSPLKIPNRAPSSPHSRLSVLARDRGEVLSLPISAAPGSGRRLGRHRAGSAGQCFDNVTSAVPGARFDSTVAACAVVVSQHVLFWLIHPRPGCTFASGDVTSPTTIRCAGRPQLRADSGPLCRFQIQTRASFSGSTILAAGPVHHGCAAPLACKVDARSLWPV